MGANDLHGFIVVLHYAPQEGTQRTTNFGDAPISEGRSQAANIVRLPKYFGEQFLPQFDFLPGIPDNLNEARNLLLRARDINGAVFLEDSFGIFQHRVGNGAVTANLRSDLVRDFDEVRFPGMNFCLFCLFIHRSFSGRFALFSPLHSRLGAIIVVTASHTRVFPDCPSPIGPKINRRAHKLTWTFNDRYNSTIKALRGQGFGQEFGHRNIPGFLYPVTRSVASQHDDWHCR